MSDISIDVAELDSVFSSQHEAREAMLVSSRKVIQLASTSIRSSHRGDFNNAEQICEEAKRLIDECETSVGQFPDIAANSLFYDAQKEYTEARCVHSILQGNGVPIRESLGVTPASYINGVVEAASELRRSVLDLLRAGEIDRANELLDVMDEVYGAVVSIDYPDALTHGLRRTTDAYRAVLERTRGDVTTATVFLRARG